MIAYLKRVLELDGLGQMPDPDLDGCALLFVYYLEKERV